MAYYLQTNDGKEFIGNNEVEAFNTLTADYGYSLEDILDLCFDQTVFEKETLKRKKK